MKNMFFLDIKIRLYKFATHDKFINQDWRI